MVEDTYEKSMRYINHVYTPRVSCLLLPVFLLSCLPHTSLNTVNLGLPRLLLSSSRDSAALFGSLSSTILSTCHVHRNLLLTSLSVKLFCTPVFSLNSTILLLSALVTLVFFVPSWSRSLCCGSSESVKVSVPYRHACVTQVFITLLFILFEIRRSAITPSTALQTIAPACTLRRTSFSLRLPVPAICPY